MMMTASKMYSLFDGKSKSLMSEAQKEHLDNTKQAYVI
jgi:hypothetical protein